MLPRAGFVRFFTSATSGVKMLSRAPTPMGTIVTDNIDLRKFIAEKRKIQKLLFASCNPAMLKILEHITDMSSNVGLFGLCQHSLEKLESLSLHQHLGLSKTHLIADPNAEAAKMLFPKFSPDKHFQFVIYGATGSTYELSILNNKGGKPISNDEMQTHAKNLADLLDPGRRLTLGS